MSFRRLALLAAVVLSLASQPIESFGQEKYESINLEDYDSGEEGGDWDTVCTSCESSDCDDCGYGIYFGARAGVMTQDRGSFRLGQITEDSNDVPAGDHVTYAEPAFDAGGDGFNVELFAGTDLNYCWSVEGRLSYVSLDEDGNFATEDLSGVPFQTGSGGFWVPFIDASQPEYARGIFGMRLRNNINVDYSYDSKWFDFGVDFVRHLSNDDCNSFDLIVGPSFANIDQETRHVTTGDWNGPQQTSDVRENLNEWFFGAKVALRTEREVTSRLSFVGGLAAHAYYHNADFQGSQYLDTAGALGDTYDVQVSDGVDNFAARLGVEAGMDYKVNKCVTIGLLYRLESWHNVSSVVNPDLTLQYVDDDNRWTGDRAAHLVDDQAVTHAAFATIEVKR